jgi:hypothetical protein
VVVVFLLLLLLSLLSLSFLLLLLLLLLVVACSWRPFTQATATDTDSGQSPGRERRGSSSAGHSSVLHTPPLGGGDNRLKKHLTSTAGTTRHGMNSDLMESGTGAESSTWDLEWE